MTESPNYFENQPDQLRNPNSRRKRLASMAAAALLFGAGVLVGEISLSGKSPDTQFNIIKIPLHLDGIPDPKGPTGKTAIQPAPSSQI